MPARRADAHAVGKVTHAWRLARRALRALGTAPTLAWLTPVWWAAALEEHTCLTSLWRF